MGDTLISVNGNDLIVSDCIIEEFENPETVYNFQVEDYHTYFVGACGIWVHNAQRCFSSSKDMYEATKNMPTEERVAIYKQEGRAVAEKHGFEKNNRLTKLNKRDVYVNEKTGDLYALDTQHGTFEHCNKKGRHIEEVDFELKQTKKGDRSGGHDLKT